jgi:hypothetical protein
VHEGLLKPIIYKLIIYNTSRWDPFVDWRIRFLISYLCCCSAVLTGFYMIDDEIF